MNALTAIRELRTAWVARSRGEQRILASAAAAAALAVLVFAVLLPLETTRRQLPVSLEKEKQVLATMEAMNASLKSQAQIDSGSDKNTNARARSSPLRGESLRLELESAARAALAPATVNVTLISSHQVSVGITGVSLQRLLLWMDAARRIQHLRLDLAAIKPVSGDSVVADLQFSRGEP